MRLKILKNLIGSFNFTVERFTYDIIHVIDAF